MTFSPLEFEQGQDKSGFHPPCVKEMLVKANEGQNLTHHERLFLVWFLLALNYPVDDVVDVFSTLPDFDREKTAYQVRFAEKKKYTPYNCSTLKSYSLCMASKYKDEICLEGYYSKKDEKTKKIPNPLSYINIKHYRASRKKAPLKNETKNEINDQKKNEVNNKK